MKRGTAGDGPGKQVCAYSDGGRSPAGAGGGGAGGGRVCASKGVCEGCPKPLCSGGGVASVTPKTGALTNLFYRGPESKHFGLSVCAASVPAGSAT